MCRYLTLALMIIILSGCKMENTDYNNYQRMYNAYNNMASYQAEAEIIINSNNTQNKYTAKQYYQSPSKTRSETIAPPDAAGVVTIVDGNRAVVTSPHIKEHSKMDGLDEGELNYLFVSSFFKTYFKSESTTLTVSGGTDDKVIALRAETGLENPYRKAVTLKSDARTLQPVSMEILGSDQKVYAAVHFKSFVLNPTLDPELFVIK